MNSPFIGVIIPFAGTFAPKGWAICDGSLLDVNKYKALFSIISYTYGGDKKNTFALPDLRARVPIHCGSGPGLTPRERGERGGNETTTLTPSLGEHTHTATFSGEPVSPSSVEILVSRSSGSVPYGSSNLLAIFKSTPSTPANLYIDPDSAGPKYKLGGVTVRNGASIPADGRVAIDPAGTGTSSAIHAKIMQPWLAMNYIIATEGEIPPHP